MKQTPRDKLISRITDIDNRCKVLLINIQEYKDNNSFERAMINEIKYRQLSLVSQELKKLLR